MDELSESPFSSQLQSLLDEFYFKIMSLYAWTSCLPLTLPAFQLDEWWFHLDELCFPLGFGFVNAWTSCNFTIECLYSMWTSNIFLSSGLSLWLDEYFDRWTSACFRLSVMIGVHEVAYAAHFMLV